jgi:hypothetical protein
MMQLRIAAGVVLAGLGAFAWYLGAPAHPSMSFVLGIMALAWAVSDWARGRAAQ